MLSIDFIRQNKEKVLTSAKNKNFGDINLDKILSLDDKRHEVIIRIQKIREERNKLAGQKLNDKLRDTGRRLKEDLKKLEVELESIENKLKPLSLEIPNIALHDVKAGKDESENDVIKTVGDKTAFKFAPKDHLELGEKLDIIDVRRTAKVSGSRFGYLKNQGVLLEFALIELALKELITESFIPIIPPTLVKKRITEGLGYWQAGGNNDYYVVKEPDIDDGLMYLVGTAEHSIVPFHADEILDAKSLPLRYAAFSTCFRREAGSYGKDTRGIFRVHQFDKIEMVSFTTPEKGDEEHDFLLSMEERLFQKLEIPYQVIKMCTGDLGFPTARKYDIEAWIPSQNKYREVTSASTTTDFQARRLNIKFKDGNKKEFAYILNGTAFAIGRTLIAILENHQQLDGSVKIPKVLQPYCGFDKIEHI
ncbi:serine--tRNA ligase [Candidatus Roizmanbacteria bacterium RIFCSPHIGHO2_02_FULL_37_13b]|uniref:Serine--tRNA ligase n=1 Tax=Candidatus Roizmanbacteria bacterium RIFCSPLOWO2_02_FULL_36_11 TaxID=1802071 RepID=A0A1F7JFV8_9BACT|nr:MAG: serine--tRNA ligase [Candidatus Roizmanbacteria bacterium RIFCSPHIGHO2_02_FULL_37_13b]OGK54446.1 MAG: serine--tRNA ligase [Candidatus Roizmanbacteria bacterium RIFCSPLOWO2_02_FULL_36_11]